MREIFSDISPEMKTMIESYVDAAVSGFIKKQQIPSLVNNFTKAMPTERLQDFVDFYFNLKMEELLNGNNHNQR